MARRKGQESGSGEIVAPEGSQGVSSKAEKAGRGGTRGGWRWSRESRVRASLRNWRDDGKTQHVFVRDVPRDLRTAIWAAAERDSVSISEWVTLALARVLDVRLDIRGRTNQTTEREPW